MAAQREAFGTLPDGWAVERVEIAGGGLTAGLLTLGATLQDLRLAGVGHPLVLGSDRPEPYQTSLRYAGALVGRYANRIGGGRFVLDGAEVQLDRNEGANTLHGGSESAGQMLWQIADLAADRVVLTLDMAEGHMGFPGRLSVQAAVTLPGEGVLAYEITATTDRPTLCNFAQHSYFNLDDGATITGHRLQIAAETYTPVGPGLIPTGALAPVAGTRFDFRSMREIGETGYDHNFVTGTARTACRPVAEVTGANGLTLILETTEPGLQVYDGVHLAVTEGLGGRLYGSRAGLALEPQIWPDSPNFPGAPSAVLRPGETYRQVTRYRFAR